MAEFLTWLEGSALGVTMRGMGVWSYGLFNLAHILGISTLFGSVLVLGLRLLGAWRRIPLTAITAPTLPLAVTGLFLLHRPPRYVRSDHRSEFAAAAVREWL